MDAYNEWHSTDTKNEQNMPQLVPFFFLNQVVFAFALLSIMIYLASKYLLPAFVALFTARIRLIK